MMIIIIHLWHVELLATDWGGKQRRCGFIWEGQKLIIGDCVWASFLRLQVIVTLLVSLVRAALNKNNGPKQPNVPRIPIQIWQIKKMLIYWVSPPTLILIVSSCEFICKSQSWVNLGVKSPSVFLSHLLFPRV